MTRLSATAALCRLVTLWAALLIVATPASAQPVPRDLGDIVNAGVLRVALTHFDLPAFHWRDTGTFDGPEIELTRQIAQALGVGIVFDDTPPSFDQVVGAVSNGKDDIGISKLSQTYYRLIRVRFSDPYLTLRHGLLYDRAAIAGISDGRSPDEVLRQFGGRIGAIKASAYIDFGIRNFPNAKILGATNWDAAVSGLKDHTYDAIYRDEFEILRLVKTQPALNVQFGAALITDQQAMLSIAVCDSCAKLQEFINYHISQTQGMFKLKNLLASHGGEK